VESLPPDAPSATTSPRLNRRFATIVSCTSCSKLAKKHSLHSSLPVRGRFNTAFSPQETHCRFGGFGSCISHTKISFSNFYMLGLFLSKLRLWAECCSLCRGRGCVLPSFARFGRTFASQQNRFFAQCRSTLFQLLFRSWNCDDRSCRSAPLRTQRRLFWRRKASHGIVRKSSSQPQHQPLHKGLLNRLIANCRRI
jgi:hypothetical protein